MPNQKAGCHCNANRCARVFLDVMTEAASKLSLGLLYLSALLIKCLYRLVRGLRDLFNGLMGARGKALKRWPLHRI